jgi:hypothetical protein
MNVCEEKRKRRLRARTRELILCLPRAAGLQIRKACRTGVPRPSPRRESTLTFLVRVLPSLSFFMHLHTHRSDFLACFIAQILPRSSEPCLPKVICACLTIGTQQQQTSPRFYACDLAPKHSQAAYLIYVSVEEKPLDHGSGNRQPRLLHPSSLV